MLSLADISFAEDDTSFPAPTRAGHGIASDIADYGLRNRRGMPLHRGLTG
jgi:hypothetical protein